MCNENYHEKNDEHTTYNVIFITENGWQKDKKPTEEMAKATIDEFRSLNPKLIEHDKHNKVEQVKDLWEFMHALFMKMHKIATSKFVEWHVDQLKEDLKKENPKIKKFPNNWRDTLGWHGGLEGATKDKISCRSRQLSFDDKKKIAKVATKFNIDLGIG